jgi:hypothetical protein
VTWLIVVLTGALGLTQLLAGRLKLLHVIPRSRWLSGAGGASVAYIFVHLLPELQHHQSTFSQIAALAWIEHHAYLIALVGFAAFYGLDRLAVVHRQAKALRNPGDSPPTDPAVFWIHLGAFGLYNALIGYLLHERLSGDWTSLVLFAGAMGLHMLVNDIGLYEHHRQNYDRFGRWLLAIAVIGGSAVGFFVKLPDAAVAVLFGLLAGSVMLNVIKEELPRERESRWWAFAVGAAGYTALLLSIG